MSVLLLWHIGTYQDSTPIAGLCHYDSKDVAFIVTRNSSYKDSIFTLYSVDEDALIKLNLSQEKVRSVIGGINDYGEGFKLRVSSGFGIYSMPSIPFPSTMKTIGEFSFNDIINPYQGQ